MGHIGQAAMEVRGMASVDVVKQTWAQGKVDLRRLAHLGERLRHHASDLAAAEYRWLVDLEEFDRGDGWALEGAKTPAHWLSWACGLGLEAARERVRVARALPDLPQVSEAMASGRLSFSKVRAITRIATPSNESLLVTYAMSTTASQLERIVREHRRSADDAADAQDLHERRRLRWWALPDGRVRIVGEYPPEQAAVVIARIEGTVEKLGEAIPPPSLSQGVDATSAREAAEAGAPEAPLANRAYDLDHPIEARRADALLRLVESARPEDGPCPGCRNRVVVHVREGDLTEERAPGKDTEGLSPADGADDPAASSPPIPEDDELLGAAILDALDTLDEQDRGGAHIEGGSGIARATARRLACDAEIIALVEDAIGMPLGVGRTSRRIPRRLRRALQERDRGCRFPGCTATRWVDAHHIVYWSEGGPTELANLILLCRHHHRLVHEVGYTIGVEPGSRFTFLRPDGQPLPVAAPPVEGDAAAPARMNANLSLGITKDSMPPDWDGSPPDYDMAHSELWDVTYPPHDPTDRAAGGVSAETSIGSGLKRPAVRG
jgi:hypothetical protein